MVTEGRTPKHPVMTQANTISRNREGLHVLRGPNMHFEPVRNLESQQHRSLQNNKPIDKPRAIPTVQARPPPHPSLSSMPPSSHGTAMNFLRDSSRDHEQRLVPTNWLLIDKNDPHRRAMPPQSGRDREEPPRSGRDRDQYSKSGHEREEYSKLGRERDERSGLSLSPPRSYPPSYFPSPSKQYSSPVPPIFSPFSGPPAYPSRYSPYPPPSYRPEFSRSPPRHPEDYPPPPPPRHSRLPFDAARHDSAFPRFGSPERDSELPFSNTRPIFHDSHHRSSDLFSHSARDPRFASPETPPSYRQFDSRVPTHLLRSEFARPEMEARRGSPEPRRELRRGSDPDVEFIRADEYVGSRRSELHHSDFRRQEVYPLRHSLSPTSPPRSPPSSSSPLYKRSYDTYTREPSLLFTPTSGNAASFPPPKFRASFPPEPRSRTPSPTRMPHTTTITRSPTHPAAGPPSPIFTMENFGSPVGDGARGAAHPKNPVKFEFKDFKENEYNLHNLQNTGGSASLLSLKQQKKHKRIINRALAQGQQVRSRAREGGDGDASDASEGSAKRIKVSAEEKRPQPDEMIVEQKPEPEARPRRKRSTQTPTDSPKERGREGDTEKEKKDEGKESERRVSKRIAQNSSDSLFEQFKSFEELQRNMVASKPSLRSSTRLRTKAMLGRSITGPLYCTCNLPETDAMVQCDSCDKWFHFECVHLTEEMAQELMQYFCTECRGRGSLVKKARIEDLISESAQPSVGSQDSSPSPSSSTSSESLSPPLSPKETSDRAGEPVEGEDWDSAEDSVQVGGDVVSLSSLAKQPWLDGWVTARNLAVKYLQEMKKMGHEFTEQDRRLPKQGSVRMSGKGKRAWRQAEVLLAIHFLKSADLVETSTKKGTLVREPSRTMAELIHRAQTVVMPNRGNIGKVKVVEFARQKHQILFEKEKEKEREKAREKERKLKEREAEKGKAREEEREKEKEREAEAQREKAEKDAQVNTKAEEKEKLVDKQVEEEKVEERKEEGKGEAKEEKGTGKEGKICTNAEGMAEKELKE